MMHRAIPMMAKTGYGRIVNVSSGMGAQSDMGSGAVPYRLSKTAMNALTILVSRADNFPVAFVGLVAASSLFRDQAFGKLKIVSLNRKRLNFSMSKNGATCKHVSSLN